MMKETPYELLKDEKKKQLGKNNEAKMTLYNALPRKEYERSAKVTAIEEAEYLATLPFDEVMGNVKVYAMVLDNDGVASKTTKEKVKSLAFKAKVTREKTSDDSDSQGGSDKDVDEEEAKAFNLMTKIFCGQNSRQKGFCYNYEIDGHFASECKNPNENKDFVGGAWSDSEDGDEPQNDATCLMAIGSQESSIVLDDMLSRKKLSQDKEGL
nr:hypothetical protein [Tanacetum cinerariifolium]